MLNVKNIALVAILAVAGILIFKAINFNNTAIVKENKILADNENLTAVISTKDNVLAGKSQVAQQYAKSVIAAIDAVMQGRYGDGGAKAVIQLIAEQNPNMDASVFKEIQQSVEVLFSNIETANRQIIDGVRNYKNYYQRQYNGFPQDRYREVRESHRHQKCPARKRNKRKRARGSFPPKIVILTVTI